MWRSILQPCKLLNGAIPAQAAMASVVASLSSPPAMGVQWSNGMCVCVCVYVCMCARARVVCTCVRTCTHFFRLCSHCMQVGHDSISYQLWLRENLHKRAVYNSSSPDNCLPWSFIVLLSHLNTTYALNFQPPEGYDESQALTWEKVKEMETAHDYSKHRHRSSHFTDTDNYKQSGQWRD